MQLMSSKVKKEISYYPLTSSELGYNPFFALKQIKTTVISGSGKG